MSTLIWARTVGCDWPECSDAVTVLEPPHGTSRPELPPGWVSLGGTVRTTRGTGFNDLCPTHARQTIADLAPVLAAQ